MSEMRAVADDGLAAAPIRPLQFRSVWTPGCGSLWHWRFLGTHSDFHDVVSRYLFETSFLWVDDVANIAPSIIAFIGGAFAYRRTSSSACAACERTASWSSTRLRCHDRIYSSCKCDTAGVASGRFCWRIGMN